jgi:hypothetical protein
MYKGIYESTNKGLGFKLTNSMSFGEYVISAGLFQKTVMGDLFIKQNQGIIPRHIHEKVLEDTRGHHTKARPKSPPSGIGRSHPHAGWHPLVPPHLHLLECSSTPPRVASTPFLKSV